MQKPIFKQYFEGEILLFPDRLDATISDTHLVRVINQVVNKLDLTFLFSTYLGGGTSAFHPRMLLKVLLYAYCLKIYTGRKIANALRSDITFMWLSGKQFPNFRTINNFRSGHLKESIDTVFKSLLLFMFEEGYIHLEEYFCDGTTIQADANKHKVVWKKNSVPYRQRVESHIDELLAEIDKLNEEEELLYVDKDLEVQGTSDVSRQDRIEDAVQELNRKMKESSDAKKVRKASDLLHKLEENTLRQKAYKEQEERCGERGGYSKTDPQATPMRTKECADDLRPAYNEIIGSEGQYITGVSVHQNPNDGTCFKNHLEQALPLLPQKVAQVVADAAFGTEENYEFLEAEKIEALLKYPSYDKEQEKSFKENSFHKDNMPYDPVKDQFLCPHGQQLVYTGDSIQTNKNGFVSQLRNYECPDCSGCPFFNQCGSKREEGHNRTIQVNENLEKHKARTREKLKSKGGKQLMKNRSHDVETCFGDTKHNMLFRRVHLRGLQKVKTECTAIAMAHNIRIMQICIEKKAEEQKKVA